MKWDYAELSKLAKENGGPEMFLDTLTTGNQAIGRSQMLPWVVVAFIVGGAAHFLIGKAVNYFSKPTKAEMETARRNLIKEINDYDSEHDRSTGEEDEADE